MALMAGERKAGVKRTRRGRKRARDRGEVRPFTVELEAALGEALKACAERDRRTKKAVLVLALEKYLTEGGYWPPPGRAAEGRG
jgi:hypothetical protein